MIDFTDVQQFLPIESNGKDTHHFLQNKAAITYKFVCFIKCWVTHTFLQINISTTHTKSIYIRI